MGTNVRVAGIVKESIVDGPGIRYVVFAQGCRHSCPGCHNPDTHSFEKGIMIETNEILRQMEGNPLLDGITISGGEPFEQAAGFAELALNVKHMGLDVVTYTGYTFEEISSSSGKTKGWDKLLGNTDILVDGRFEIDKRNLMLKFRGSDNQRIIDVRRSIQESRAVAADDKKADL